MNKIVHTIFTPIFNRANMLKNVWDSIKDLNYPSHAFEWLIIDDGSTDNLKEVLKTIEFGDVNVRIIHKENGGIHTAHNCALKYASGEYITRVDSDDMIMPDALQQMDTCLEKIKNDDFEEIIGVVGLCLNKVDNSIRGAKFEKDFCISRGYIERRKGAKGDKCFCMKKTILRQFLIPELPYTKWVPEGIIWNRIDRKYKTCFVNIPFSICTEPSAHSMMGSMDVWGKDRSLSACMSSYYGSLYAINESASLLSPLSYIKKHLNIWINIFSCAKFPIKKVLIEIHGWHIIPSIILFVPSYFYFIILIFRWGRQCRQNRNSL